MTGEGLNNCGPDFVNRRYSPVLVLNPARNRYGYEQFYGTICPGMAWYDTEVELQRQEWRRRVP